MKSLLSVIFGFLGATVALADVAIIQDQEEWRVEMDGKLFTKLSYKDLKTPSLYPIIGPGGVEMMRNYPFKKDVKGEPSDHPHHVSLWYNHGDVNGIDFWSYGHGGKGGKIVLDKLIKFAGGESEGEIITANKWLALADEKLICRDERRMRFGKVGAARYIDFQIKIMASEGELTFADTKEGTMAIRTNPRLALKGEGAAGKALNSAGDKDQEVWGKSAQWVDYWADFDGKTLGIAIFDHPSNPRHPTTWHARDYGLIAANPFGWSEFFKDKTKRGDMTVKHGEGMTFRYRFLFHEGDAENGQIRQHFEAFAASN